MKFRSKMLADLVEALIGAAYCSGKEEGAFAFLAYNNICPRPPSKPHPSPAVITGSRIPPCALRSPSPISRRRFGICLCARGRTGAWEEGGSRSSVPHHSALPSCCCLSCGGV